MYLRDLNTGMPYGISTYSFDQSMASSLSISSISYEVDGVEVQAVRLHCASPCLGPVTFTLHDEAGHSVTAAVRLKYRPITISILNTEGTAASSDDYWHLQLVVDNPSDIPMTINVKAVGTGTFTAVTTAANVPSVEGMRTWTEMMKVSGVLQVFTHMYKDYEINDSVNSRRTSDVTTNSDGTKTYELFKDSWRQFMNVTLEDMDSFTYRAWITFQQRDVLTEGKLKEQTLRLKIEIIVDESVSDVMSTDEITFMNELAPTQSWSTTYYGYMDDRGYNLQEPWVYWNGVEFNNGTAWNDELGIQ